MTDTTQIDQPSPTAVPVLILGRTEGCMQCDTTKRHLDRQGTPYTFRDVDAHPDAFAKAVRLGYSGIPVVIAGDMHWQGYRPDRCNQLANIDTYAPDLSHLDEAARAYLDEAELEESGA